MNKLYVFVHSYLSDLQKGIQTAHLVGILSAKYIVDAPVNYAQRSYITWVRFDRTIVVLNSKNNQTLNNLYHRLYDDVNCYPWCGYWEEEDEDTMRSSFTAVGIVLPSNFNKENRFDLIQDRMTGHVSKEDEFDIFVAELLNDSECA